MSSPLFTLIIYKWRCKTGSNSVQTAKYELGPAKWMFFIVWIIVISRTSSLKQLGRGLYYNVIHSPVVLNKGTALGVVRREGDGFQLSKHYLSPPSFGLIIHIICIVKSSLFLVTAVYCLVFCRSGWDTNIATQIDNNISRWDLAD